MRDDALQPMIGLPRLTAGRRMLAIERMAAKVSHVARASPLVDPITDGITAQSTTLLVLSTWYRAPRSRPCTSRTPRKPALVITRRFIDGPKSEMARLAPELLGDLFLRELNAVFGERLTRPVGDVRRHEGDEG